MHDIRIWIVLVAVLGDVGALLLCLAAADLIGALCIRLWLLISPTAARQERFRAALATYRKR